MKWLKLRVVVRTVISHQIYVERDGERTLGPNCVGDFLKREKPSLRSVIAFCTNGVLRSLVCSQERRRFSDSLVLFARLFFWDDEDQNDVKGAGPARAFCFSGAWLITRLPARGP
jgi:hypothetical protein